MRIPLTKLLPSRLGWGASILCAALGATSALLAPAAGPASPAAASAPVAEPPILPAQKLAIVRDGNTLGQLLAELGPGWLPTGPGLGTHQWHFSDGTVLYIWYATPFDPRKLDPVLFQAAFGATFDLRDPQRCPFQLERRLPGRRAGKIIDVSADETLAALPVTRVTVDIDRQFAPQAARALSVTGMSVEIDRGAYFDLRQNRIVTIQLRDVPFLEALLELRQQIGADLDKYSSTKQRVVHLQYAPTEVPPWCVAGPFAVLFHGISREVHNTGERSATLRLDLLAEPGFYVAQSLQDVQCPGLEDDKHQPLALAQDRHRGDHPATLTLKLPATPGRRIPLLKGTVDARVMRTVPVEAPDLKIPRTMPPVAGMKVELSSLESENDSPNIFFLRVKYTRDRMPAEQWKEVQGLVRSAQPILQAADGQTIFVSGPPYVPGPIPTNVESVELRYTVSIPDGVGPPAKVTLHVPTALVDVRVPFEFQDVVIP
jgi:hypothetical protein